MADVVLTPAQARSLAVVAENHPDALLTVYPAISGAIGVDASGEVYVINGDGTPDPQAVTA